jgi:serine/threonine-protein kinase
MDFGIAKVLEGMHGTNTQSIGTLQYMSPEQIDARTIDPRSDLYSLGLMFYEMLAGAPPFSSASPRELLNLQCTAAAPPLDEAVRGGIPRGVEEMLFALLEKKPAARPASARDVADRLSLFRAAGGPPRVPARAEERQSGAPPTPRMAGAPAVPPPSAVAGPVAAPAPRPPTNHEPRTDTVALALANDRSRDVPTWLAIVAIVALSLVAGMTTYLFRLKSPSDRSSPPTASASTLRR